MLITASGQPGVELAVPLGVAAQADRAAGHDRLDDPAERVAGLLGRVDRRDDRRVGLGVERVDRAGVADRQVERQRRRGDPAQLADVAEDRDPQLAQQQLGQAADGDPQGRLAGAGAFEDLADAGLVVDRAGQVDVAAPRATAGSGRRSSLASLLIRRSVIGAPVVTP